MGDLGLVLKVLLRVSRVKTSQAADDSAEVVDLLREGSRGQVCVEIVFGDVGCDFW